MHLWWFISIIVYSFRPSYTWWWGGGATPPWLESYHYPGFFTPPPSRYVNGTETMTSDPKDTPDWRIEEPHYVLYREAFAKELERPSRNSPPYKQSEKIWWARYWRSTEKETGCFCNTVYRRYTLLAGCAVITTRHILTTATPTALILRSYSHLKTLKDILGSWYDITTTTFNSSMYMTPARIHIHPLYKYDYEVNVSHPIPAMYDLSLWAGTIPLYKDAILCPRAANGWSEYTSSIPRWYDISVVAGFMFMKSYNRRPLPWFRYIVKTKSHVWPCPKSDWQWFHCIMGEYWGKYGFDSGGGMYGAYNDGSRFDGLAGLCAFSLKLRSKQMVHYFTVIDCHPVLDFLYDAMLGLQKCVYLDDRFEDTKWKSPTPWWGEYIDYGYTWGQEVYYSFGDVPKYRR